MGNLEKALNKVKDQINNSNTCTPQTARFLFEQKARLEREILDQAFKQTVSSIVNGVNTSFFTIQK